MVQEVVGSRPIFHPSLKVPDIWDFFFGKKFGSLIFFFNFKLLFYMYLREFLIELGEVC